MLLDDIYYSDEYIKLYLNKTSVFKFIYKDGNNFFINKSIKKPILQIGKREISDGYFDLETAYGYGGFYVKTDSKKFLKNAMTKYIKKCIEENIIAEFIRFHPFNDFPIKYNKYLDFYHLDRNTVSINIGQKYELIKSEYASSLKRNVKKANTLKLEFKKEIKDKQNIKKFYELYIETMKNKKADKFYFFDINYFNDLLNNSKTELFSAKSNNQIITMIILLISNKNIYYHLGASHPAFYDLCSNPALFDYIIKEYALKYNCFYLGGGLSSDLNDSLFKFKKKFSNNLKPFYIAGNIYNKDIYEKYNNIWEEQKNKNNKYFLKYRG